MEIEKLVQASMDEILKVLNNISVLGEPKTVEGVVLIPVVSTGLMFGAGGGEGKQPIREQAVGEGGGAGGGLGIRARAIIIVDQNGARVEPIKSSIASVAEKIAEKAPEVMSQMMEKRKESKEEKKEG